MFYNLNSLLATRGQVVRHIFSVVRTKGALTSCRGIHFSSTKTLVKIHIQYYTWFVPILGNQLPIAPFQMSSLRRSVLATQ